MAATKHFVQFLRRLANGNTEGVGNQVQLGDTDGEPIGTVANPLVTTGAGAGGVGIVQLDDENGDPIGEANPLPVRPFSSRSVTTPTIDAAVNYAAGDCIGGIVTIGPTSVEANQRVRLVSLTIIDKAGQAPALILYLFSAAPAGAGGVYTDNNPIVWGTNDVLGVNAVIDIAAANYKTVAGCSVQTLSNINIICVIDGAGALMRGLIAANGAYNAAATNDLRLVAGFEVL